MSKENIPAAFLQPVINSKFSTEDHALSVFDYGLDVHGRGDCVDGCTPVYNYTPMLTDTAPTMLTFRFNEVKAMAKHIPDEFVKADGGRVRLNQHYDHSLSQFLATVQKAWDDHVERTNALIGTPSGRLRP